MSRRRRFTAIALVALASLLAFVALLAIWANRQVLDTENWTERSTRVLATPAVRDRVAGYLVDRLYAEVDVAAQIEAALPERLAPLAEPAAGALRTAAERTARDQLSRARTQQAWENANRTAHTLLIRALEGGGPIVGTQDGIVVLDLHELLTELQERVGIGGRAAGRLPEDAARLTLMRSEQIGTAQDLFKLLDALPIIAVVLSLGLFGGALAVAPTWRRQAVLGYGAGLAGAGIAALVTARLLGDAVVGAVATTEAGVPAAEQVWSILTELLDEAATAAIGYGALLLLGGWLAGPSRPARAARRVTAPYLRDPAVAYGAFALLVVLVVVWWAPTPATRNPLTAVLLVALAAVGFEALRRRAVREFPAADPAGADGRASPTVAQHPGAPVG
ncbi:MAG TPA: hypothetical protein VE526_13895 [Solirubrobacteraceae bacterium]|jgi:hypothetical protein|nr:hypothetical protein [Solirubrobacteraceae bacterium]